MSVTITLTDEEAEIFRSLIRLTATTVYRSSGSYDGTLYAVIASAAPYDDPAVVIPAVRCFNSATAILRQKLGDP